MSSLLKFSLKEFIFFIFLRNYLIPIIDESLDSELSLDRLLVLPTVRFIVVRLEGKAKFESMHRRYMKIVVSFFLIKRL